MQLPLAASGGKSDSPDFSDIAAYRNAQGVALGERDAVTIMNALAFRMREDGASDSASSEVFRLVEGGILRDGMKGYRSKELSTIVWAFDRLELGVCRAL